MSLHKKNRRKKFMSEILIFASSSNFPISQSSANCAERMLKNFLRQMPIFIPNRTGADLGIVLGTHLSDDGEHFHPAEYKKIIKPKKKRSCWEEKVKETKLWTFI